MFSFFLFHPKLLKKYDYWSDLSLKMFPSGESVAARAQFHQRSTYEFFVQTYVLAAFTTYLQLEKAAEMTFVRKTRAYKVDENDGRDPPLRFFYLSQFFLFSVFFEVHWKANLSVGKGHISQEKEIRKKQTDLTRNISE